ncbi:MAG TPA: redoxin domain-containing protein [Candidatus Paceibacterota bacterium]|nr:redoxin domain-containing protein [Verrucomicrobiota bacterium]HSA11211.1 redoxin domain-containing protein [Candidatus Paceibacterota bacterium]
MKHVFALFAGIGLLSTGLFAAEVGKAAPDFTATDINGQTHKLSDYKGKIVVLESYNLDCPFVRNHYRSGAMQELQRDLIAKGAVWFIVNSVASKHPSYRTAEAAKKEWASQKLAATAWLDDSSGEVGKAYGMKTTPHMFVIDKEGVLAFHGAIDDRAASEGDPRTARNYVREAVEKLLAGEKPLVSQNKPYGCGVKYGG